MTYYLLDFSGTNETAPTQGQLRDLREAGVETSYEYGMSLSGDPKATLDLYYNARTSLSQEALSAELQKLDYPPRIQENSSEKRTMRGRTVKEELDSAQER